MVHFDLLMVFLNTAVLPATRTFIHEWNEPLFLYSQPQSITAAAHF